jgi:predicted MPP superfamily phosphohydrolase
MNLNYCLAAGHGAVVHGTFALTGGRRMYISRGVGHLLQVRFNVRPEIPIFRLQRES